MKYSDKNPLVRLEKISYFNDGNCVLKDISLQISSGKIHAIVGDHGSGKSYISDILSGINSPGRGELYFNGKQISGLTIKRAQRLGIQTVHQDFSLIENFSIAENLYTPDIIKSRFPLNKGRIISEARHLLEDLKINLDASTLYKDLNLSGKILISTLRALIRNPSLLILDEALEKLSGTDFKMLKSILLNHVNQGMAMLCFSHKIDDIYNFADSVTIIRNGQIFLTDTMDNMDRINLIKLCYSQLSDDTAVSDISREFYQLLKYNEAILQKLPINLIVTDDHNRIKMINDTGKNFFSVRGKSFRDKDILSLFGSENASLINIITTSFHKREESVCYNIPLHLDQRRTIVNFRTFPIYDGAFLIGNIIILEDISEQEKLREQIHLSEKLASVGLLAAGVAHEINNPLEIVFNHLNFLNMNIANTDQKEIINEIIGELHDIKTIVSNLISFSDNNNASIEQFNLNDLVKSLINLIRFNARHKNIQIQFHSDLEDIEIQASKNEMKQVFLNLFKNSFEAIPGGGVISIRTERKKVDGQKLVCITMQDTGKGIDKDHVGDIFLPFFSTKKSSENNLGLGLSVIYGIIKKYKGNITASNLDEGGCEFIISLPCVQDGC